MHVQRKNSILQMIIPFYRRGRVESFFDFEQCCTFHCGAIARQRAFAVNKVRDGYELRFEIFIICFFSKKFFFIP